jgi:hypothetical protein
LSARLSLTWLAFEVRRFRPLLSIPSKFFSYGSNLELIPF